MITRHSIFVFIVVSCEVLLIASCISHNEDVRAIETAECRSKGGELLRLGRHGMKRCVKVGTVIR